MTEETAAPTKSPVDEWFDLIEDFVAFTESDVFKSTMAAEWVKPHADQFRNAVAALEQQDACKAILVYRNCDQTHMEVDAPMKHVATILRAQKDQLLRQLNMPARDVGSVVGSIQACLHYRYELPNAHLILQQLRLRQRLREITDLITSDSTASLTAEASKLLREITTEASQLIAQVQVHAKSAKESADAAAQATGIAATNAHAKRHAALADLARKHADDWTERAFWTAAFLLVAIFTLPFASASIPAQASTAVVVAELIRVFSGKLAVLSLMLYGLSVCVKNYRAHTHNALIHEHRAAVFKTFESFVKAAKPETQDIVLAQTLQLVLAQQPTGFLSNEPDMQPVTQTADLIEKIAKLKGGKD